jgi:hypothetical protein
MVPHLPISTRPYPHSRRGGVYESPIDKVDPLTFIPGQAHVLHPQVKPQHLGSENHQSRDTLRSAPLSPIPDRLFRAHPRQSTQNAFSCRFYLTHGKNHYSHPQTHASRSSAHTHAYIHIYSSRTIKDRINKRRQCKVHHHHHAYKVKR